MFQVFVGKKTFVGYFQSQNSNSKNLPNLKQGILRPFNVSQDAEDDSNLFYAKNYKATLDVVIIFNNWSILDI